MAIIWAEQALTDGGWQRKVQVTVNRDGRIATVRPDCEPAGLRVGVLLPAPVNVHSHAFQRALAGLTERRGSPGDTDGDSFWTWRRLMYRLLEQLSPDDIEAITAFAQMEMLEAGYSTSVEFHYLHHQPDGTPYARLAETSERIVAAAAQTGIGLTLLPVFYQYGGCDGRDLAGAQRRFGNDPERFARLLDGAQAALAQLPADARIGVAPHSLRAVSAPGLNTVVGLAGEGPIHMHLAEQAAEVAEVQTVRGRRPAEWLLEYAEPNRQWCLIHCTQMLPHETVALAASGAVAGLCPITEASLGDGIFDGVRWLDAGGAIAVGSDSNVRITLAEELRLLEYTQRLRDGSRAALASASQSTGRRLFSAVNHGGARAAGRDAGRIAAGAWADLLALDHSHVDLAGRGGDVLLDSYIFAGDDRLVSEVWSAGRHRVSNGVHRERDVITRRYRAVTQTLGERL